MSRRFVGQAIAPIGESYLTVPDGLVPPLPACFAWEGSELEIRGVLRTWRSSKTDRGDVYLKRHWFEVETSRGIAQIYYDREAGRGRAHWWLYTIEAAS